MRPALSTALALTGYELVRSESSDHAKSRRDIWWFVEATELRSGAGDGTILAETWGFAEETSGDISLVALGIRRQAQRRRTETNGGCVG